MNETLDVERMARAVLRAAGEEGRRPTSDGFEWYASADDMAADIAREYAIPDTFTSADSLIRRLGGTR